MAEERYRNNPWEEKEQKILANSRVILVGLDEAGEKVLMQLVALGIGSDDRGHIRVVHNGRPKQGNNYLDMLYDPRYSKVSQVRQFCKKQNPDVNVIEDNTIFDQVNRHRLSNNLGVNYDLVVDATNDPASKRVALEFAKENKLPFISLSADQSKGCLDTFDGNGKDETGFIRQFDDYVGSEQGLSISGILAGVTAEEVKNRLIKSKDILKKKVFYNVASEKRFDEDKDYHSDSGQGFFRNKKVLLVGAGGLGSLSVDWLARMSINFDVVDFDKVAPNNLNRQIPFYDSVGKFKSYELANKYRKVNPNIRINGLYGIVAKEWTDYLIKKVFKSIVSVDVVTNREISNELIDMVMASQNIENIGSYELFLAVLKEMAISYYHKKELHDYLSRLRAPILVNGRFLRTNDYDLIIDNLDNVITRYYLHQMSYTFGVPLISCGTNIRGANVFPYNPGKTSCLDCQFGIAAQARTEIKNNGKKKAGKNDDEHRCIFASEPSVIMSNFICSYIASELIRTIFDSKTFGPTPNMRLDYNIDSDNVLSGSERISPKRCKHAFSYDV